MGELQIPMWDWWIVLYFFVGGIAGGAYFTSAMIEFVGRPEDRPIARMGYYIAFPLSLVCAIALIADLGVPTRFYHMMVYSKTLLPWPKWDSAISVGAYALLLFGGFGFLSFIDALVETGKLPWAPFREKYSGMPRKIYSVLGGLSGSLSRLVHRRAVSQWTHPNVVKQSTARRVVSCFGRLNRHGDNCLGTRPDQNRSGRSVESAQASG